VASKHTLEKLAGADVSSIGSDGEPAQIKHHPNSSSQERKATLNNVKDHSKAFEHVLDAFLDDKNVNLSSKEDIKYAVHRVVRKNWPPRIL
jgi:acetate kinase